MEAFRGLFYVDREFRERYVLVEDGVIRKISVDSEGSHVTPVPGFILPGGVDMHVHFRDPGEEEKEDFRSGSISAALGGTTTVFDMPNNKIPVKDERTFRAKREIVSGKSFVDFGLYQLASESIVESATGEKIFLGKSTGGIITDVSKCSWSRKVKVVHAELQECLESNATTSRNLVEQDRSRPIECELSAIEKVAEYLRENVHIAHVTSSRGLSLARAFRFSTEVTPHHLLLNNTMDLGPFGKVNPPLRKKPVQEELLNSLNLGNVDVISSDHAPHTREDKSVFQDSPSGVPGVETRVPLVLDLFRKGLISGIDRAVSLLMENPARICRVNKGYIAVGYDADFISVDFDKSKKIKGEELHSKAGWSPFEGYEGIFPQEVYLRGELLAQEGEIVGSQRGVFLDGKAK